LVLVRRVVSNAYIRDAEPKAVFTQARIVAQASSSETRGPQNIGSMAAWARRSESQRGPTSGASAGIEAAGRTVICFFANISEANDCKSA
jgi:hypothetical protein